MIWMESAPWDPDQLEQDMIDQKVPQRLFLSLLYYMS